MSSMAAESPVGATDSDRRQALAGRVAREVGGGWNVQSQTDYQAVLVRHGTKINHLLHLVLSLVTLGLWLPVWVFLAVVKKREKHKVVAVDAYGNVTVTRR